MNRRNDKSKRREPVRRGDAHMPESVEAEAAVLGAMLLDPNCIDDVASIIPSPEDFYHAKNAAIYVAMVTLRNKSKPVDAVHLRQFLADREELDDVGGVEYLINLVDAVPSAAAAAHYAQIVVDKARLRDIIEKAEEITQDAYHSHDEAADQIDRAEAKMFAVASKSQQGQSDTVRIGKVTDEWLDEIENSDGGEVTGLPTGFLDLDGLLTGLKPAELIIMAARPSMGKTAFAMQCAMHLAGVSKVPTAFFSLEMSRKSLNERIVSSESGVDFQAIRKRRLSGEQFAQINITANELRETPLFIDDQAGISLMQLRSKARKLVARDEVQVIFIDYLQLMTCPGQENRQQEVSQISKGLKTLAMELDVPVIALSQLNRQIEGRGNRRPMMSDLRESGSIEQDADVIVMLHREDYYRRSEPDYTPTNEAEAIVVKQRNGPTDTVRLHFESRLARFNNLVLHPIDQPDIQDTQGVLYP